VHSGTAVLPGLRADHRAVAARADRQLVRLGVRIRTVAVPGLESLPHDVGGRLVTDETLLVAPGVWAAGDAARVAHPRTGKPVAASALWAIKAGAHLESNLARVIEGRRPRVFRYRGLGQAMAFGIGRSASEFYGVPIPGIAGWLLRLGFFLPLMPQRRRAVTVLRSLLSLPFRGRFVARDRVASEIAVGDAAA